MIAVEIRGLTLYQPWAGLVALKAKRIETRSWSTSWRGLVAIHAGKGEVGRAIADELLPTAGILPSAQPAALRARGAVVAVARIADCMPTDQAVKNLAPLGSKERDFGDYSFGRFAWLLEDVRLIEPAIPCRGALSLWTPDEALMAHIRDRMAHA